MCSAAADAATSVAWMFPSTQYAGFSSAGPVFALVIDNSHSSRPSWLRPIDATLTRSGRSRAHACTSAVSSS
jgi:hypothetical protein